MALPDVLAETREWISATQAEVRRRAEVLRPAACTLPRGTHAEREAARRVLDHLDHAHAYGHPYVLSLALDALAEAERAAGVRAISTARPTGEG